ncbi:MAG: tetratricopeptide repeat protein [Deltaproteobacteria bacterium]|nr:tetratricopeptide repeat protein [Deltaproteobacteria bacterium]
MVFPIGFTGVSTGPSVTLVSFNLNLGSKSGYLGPPGQKTDVEPTELGINWHLPQPNDLKPSTLLRWNSRYNEFVGRKREMEALKSWCLSEAPVSVKFIIGEGGTGKSRLAAEFAEEFKGKHKWSAGFVHLRRPTPFKFKNDGILFILDYPEEQRGELDNLMRDLAEIDQTELKRAGKKIRVLFLTRQPYKEWEEVFNRTRSTALIAPDNLQLRGIDVSEASKLFKAGRKKTEQASEPNQYVPPTLSLTEIKDWTEKSEINRRPLFIIAAAHYCALNPEEKAINYSGPEIIDFMAGREINLLKNSCSKEVFRDPNLLVNLKLLANISGVVSKENLRELLKTAYFKDAFFDPAQALESLKEYKLLVEDQIPALETDILAAAFTSLIIGKSEIDLPEFIWLGVAMNPERGVVRLARLTYDIHYNLDNREVDLVKPLIQAVKGNKERCESLEPSVQKELPTGILDLGIAVYETLVVENKDAHTTAVRLNNLGNLYYRAGRPKEALDVSLKAFELYEKLSKNQPEKYEPDLAMSYNNLGNCYAGLGRYQEALEASIKAYELYEKLAETQPEAYEPDLAMSLINLGNCYSNLGQYDKALEANSEAVERYKKLAETQPDAFEFNLAKSYNNLRNSYAGLGQHEKALEAISEAVNLFEKLAKTQPEAIMPDLAMSYNNLGICYSELGRHQEALDVSLKAFKIREKLAKAQPEAYEPDLAMSYGTLGRIYLGLEQPKEASDHFKKGIRSLNKYFLKNPPAFAPLMVGLLNGYLETSEKAGIEPDESLLKPIRDRFQELDGQ